jgi:hypothetical protein
VKEVKVELVGPIKIVSEGKRSKKSIREAKERRGGGGSLTDPIIIE